MNVAQVVVVSEETETGSLDLWANIDSHGIPVIVAGKDSGMCFVNRSLWKELWIAFG